MPISAILAAARSEIAIVADAPALEAALAGIDGIVAFIRRT